MNGDEKARVASKIRALFAKTPEAGATVEEAAAAAAKAQELITTYNLTLSDLEVQDEGRYVKVIVGHVCPKKFVRTHQHLLHVIARANFCRSVRHWLPKSELVGRPENIEFVTWLYSAVQNDIVRLIREQKPEWARSSWKRAFWYGAMRTVQERLHDQRERMEQAAEGAKVTALVLVTEQALDRAVYELIGQTTTGRAAGPKKHTTAYEAGKRAGARININRPMGGGPSPKALS